VSGLFLKLIFGADVLSEIFIISTGKGGKNSARYLNRFGIP